MLCSPVPFWLSSGDRTSRQRPRWFVSILAEPVATAVPDSVTVGPYPFVVILVKTSALRTNGPTPILPNHNDAHSSLHARLW